MVFLKLVHKEACCKEEKVKVTKCKKRHWCVVNHEKSDCGKPKNCLKYHLKLLPILHSVVKMIFMSTFLFISFISLINGQRLPNQKFVTDLVTNFNRFGIIFHLPAMKFYHIHDYYKSIKQYKWVKKKTL